MANVWGEHLDIARAIELIGQYDVPQGFARLGAALHLLQRDLIFMSLAEEEALMSLPMSPTKSTKPVKALQILG